MPIYKVWITTQIERSMYVDAEDAPTAEWATWEYLNDSAAFWPALPVPWDYADAEDYIDADGSGPHEEMAPGDIRAVLAESGDVGYVSIGESEVIEEQAGSQRPHPLVQKPLRPHM